MIANKYILAAFGTALAAMGMTSCSNDLDYKETGTKGELVEMSVTLSREDLSSDTKTVFTDDEGLSFTWGETDKIEVRGYSDGKTRHLGTLTVDANSINGTKAKFTGRVESLGESATYDLYYTGENEVKASDSKLEVTLPGEDHSVSGLGKNDVMRCAAVMEPTKTGIGGQFNLKRVFAFLTITLNLPNEVENTNGAEITFTGKGISSVAEVSLEDVSAEVTNKNNTTDGSITLKMDAGKTSQKYYFNILPGSISDLNFTTTIGDVTYTATKLVGSSLNTNANQIYNTTINLKAVTSDVKLIGDVNCNNAGSNIEKLIEGVVLPYTQNNVATLLGTPVRGEKSIPGDTDRFKFLGWYADNNLTSEAASVTFNKGEYEKTVYAKWEILKYRIVYTDGADGAVFGDQNQILVEGATIADFNNIKDNTNIPSRKGYIFKGWTPAQNFTVKPDVADENGVITYMATWEKDNRSTFGVTASGAEGKGYGKADQ